MGKALSKDNVKAKFTKAELELLRKICDLYSAKPNGALTQKQLMNLFTRCTGGLNLDNSNLDFDCLFKFISRNNEELVTYKELVRFLAVYKKGTVKEKLVDIFETYDRDEKGHLNQEEVEQVKQTLAETCSPAMLEKILSKLTNNDGTITKKDWIRHGSDVRLDVRMLGADFVYTMNTFKLRAL